MDRLLENNTVLKILSLLVALFLWFDVTSTNAHATADRTIGPIPVVYQPPAKADLTIMSMTPTTVSVQIKGPLSTIHKTNPTTISAFVDMKNLTHSGTYTLPVHISVPVGASFVSVVPVTVTVVVDQLGTRHISVALKSVGAPAPGYELDDLTANTLSATLSGPSTDLKQVKSVIAEVPVAGRTSGFQEQVILIPINSADREVQNVEVSPTMVNASASIKQIPPQKRVSVVAKISGHPASGYAVGNIVVHPDSIKVTGTKAELAGLSVIYTQPVSVSGDTGSVTTPAAIAFPSGVSGLTVQDVTVSVTINAAG